MLALLDRHPLLCAVLFLALAISASYATASEMLDKAAEQHPTSENGSPTSESYGD